ncbi:MAG: response regulator [SAR324 cluster bacterium]|nr:response regulator [SAR324 cluster bacterium]
MARILLVDDSAFIVGTLRPFLESEGHEIVAVGTDGNEGVALFQEHHPDLVLLDITMPNKDGRACLEEILELDAKAKVIMVSAIQDMKIFMECMKKGALNFIQKPLKLRDPAFCLEFRKLIDEALTH